MTLHKQRVVLHSPYGKLSRHFQTYLNGEKGTFVRQAPDGFYVVIFDEHAGEVKVPQHWLAWVSEHDPEAE